VPPVDTDVPSYAGCVLCWAAGLLPARPRAPDESAGWSDLPGSCVTWHRETMLVLGWALDQIQYKGYSTTHAQHITHTHRHLRAAQWVR